MEFITFNGGDLKKYFLDTHLEIIEEMYGDEVDEELIDELFDQFVEHQIAIGRIQLASMNN